MTYKDKVKHGAASFIIFTVVAIITKNLVFSFIATYSLGIIKEIYDQIRQKNTPIQSFQDIVSDMVGIVLGIFLYSMVIG
ncbi:MAG: hypothetical protein US74_C0033G0006 [Parcubacteria group bacterium GW2011_GWA2_38_13]|nr:MAG: hypothetical protein US74_C0033G0006 [Parcubacteria group bacterium GW2011_GWA2_38_13]